MGSKALPIIRRACREDVGSLEVYSPTKDIEGARPGPYWFNPVDPNVDLRRLFPDLLRPSHSPA